MYNAALLIQRKVAGTQKAPLTVASSSINVSAGAVYDISADADCFIEFNQAANLTTSYPLYAKQHMIFRIPDLPQGLTGAAGGSVCTLNGITSAGTANLYATPLIG